MGPFLGQCTSELSGKIERFVTTGAKSYAYKEILENGDVKVTSIFIDLKQSYFADQSQIQRHLPQLGGRQEGHNGADGEHG